MADSGSGRIHGDGLAGTRMRRRPQSPSGNTRGIDPLGPPLSLSPRQRSPSPRQQQRPEQQGRTVPRSRHRVDHVHHDSPVGPAVSIFPSACRSPKKAPPPCNENDGLLQEPLQRQQHRPVNEQDQVLQDMAHQAQMDPHVLLQEQERLWRACSASHQHQHVSCATSTSTGSTSIHLLSTTSTRSSPSTVVMDEHSYDFPMVLTPQEEPILGPKTTTTQDEEEEQDDHSASSVQTSASPPPLVSSLPQDHHKNDRIVWVEITPNHSVPLRGAAETRRCIAQNWFVPLLCHACHLDMFGIPNAAYVLCPVCRVVNPLAAAASSTRTNTTTGIPQKRHGLGLGFTATDLQSIQQELQQQQEDNRSSRERRNSSLYTTNTSSTRHHNNHNHHHNMSL